MGVLSAQVSEPGPSAGLRAHTPHRPMLPRWTFSILNSHQVTCRVCSRGHRQLTRNHTSSNNQV